MRYEAWDNILNQTYGKWDACKEDQQGFNADLKSTIIGSLNIIECECDPCGGVRGHRNISQSDSEFLAIQLVLGGRENIEFDGERYCLEAGDIFIWDSTSPMSFEVTERLNKISIKIPLNRFKNWIPERWGSFNRKLGPKSVNRRLLSPLISTMVDEGFSVTPMNDQAISEGVIALLVGGIEENDESKSGSIKLAQLVSLKEYIKRHIYDPNLSISSIAETNKISTRYVHWLFSENKNTVSEFILSQRMKHCRKDLLNESMNRRSISEIAFSTGFRSPAYFSRRYKELFGEAPRDTRKK